MQENDLVIMEDQQAVTTSLKVAKVFSKKHQHIMEKIRKLTVENSTVKNMFVESTYVNERGQEQPMYYMNRDGFTLLAMGFTGDKALQFKLEYIEAFNAMEQKIKQQQPSLPQTPEERLALTMVVTNRLNKRVSQVEEDVDYLKNRSEIDSAQRFKLRQARNRKAVQVCGGKKSNFYLTKNAPRKVFKQLEHDFKEKFMISRYEDLTKEDFDSAIDFIKNWYPSYPLKQEIDQANGQTRLSVM